MPQRIRGDVAGRNVTTPRCCTRAVPTLLIRHNGVFDDIGAVVGLASCAVRKVEAVELVACQVFNMADRDDRSVSMEMVRTRLDRLREHPAGCCQLCRAAVMVAPADVYRIAKQWEWQATATRLRALR